MALQAIKGLCCFSRCRREQPQQQTAASSAAAPGLGLTSRVRRADASHTVRPLVGRVANNPPRTSMILTICTIFAVLFAAYITLSSAASVPGAGNQVGPHQAAPSATYKMSHCGAELIANHIKYKTPENHDVVAKKIKADVANAPTANVKAGDMSGPFEAALGKSISELPRLSTCQVGVNSYQGMVVDASEMTNSIMAGVRKPDVAPYDHRAFIAVKVQDTVTGEVSTQVFHQTYYEGSTRFTNFWEAGPGPLIGASQGRGLTLWREDVARLGELFHGLPFIGTNGHNYHLAC